MTEPNVNESGAQPNFVIWVGGEMLEYSEPGKVPDVPDNAVQFMVRRHPSGQWDYYLAGGLDAPVEPFLIELQPSGALVISNSVNSEAVRIYAPGRWSELSRPLRTWTGATLPIDDV